MPDSAPASTDRTIELRVLRYRPELDGHPFFDHYTVAYSDDMSVLQGLQVIKDSLDSSLSYRWSCRMAVCGSCGMMINGAPRLACNSFLRDLVVTVGDFVKKIEGIYTYLIPKTARRLEEGEYLQTPAELAAYESFSDCINCMLCYAACPQFGANPDFIGPGAMAILQRYNGDSRDGGQQQRLDRIHGEDGVWSCTAVGLCSDVCPKQVDPANAVNQNKTKSAFDFFLRFLKRETGQ